MTTDDFTQAARAESWVRHPDPVDVDTGEPVDDWGFEEQSREDFLAGAEWAAAQEPSGVAVEDAIEDRLYDAGLVRSSVDPEGDPVATVDAPLIEVVRSVMDALLAARRARLRLSRAQAAICPLGATGCDPVSARVGHPAEEEDR